MSVLCLQQRISEVEKVLPRYTSGNSGINGVLFDHATTGYQIVHYFTANENTNLRGIEGPHWAYGPRQFKINARHWDKIHSTGDSNGFQRFKAGKTNQIGASSAVNDAEEICEGSPAPDQRQRCGRQQRLRKGHAA